MTSWDYDAIVIGSGAGGAAAAYRLALAGLNVALLEKGNHLPTDGSTLDIQRVVHEGAFLSREPWTDGGGLYVVDGSVLPRSSRVNPSLTIYAWGLRVGDLVARAAK